MIRFEHSIQIDQPRDRVYALITDLDRLPEWQTGVIQSQRLSEGDLRVGFQFSEVAKVGPWKLNTVCTVTDVKQNERFAFDAKSNGPISYSGSFEFQPLAGGTRLTLNAQARLHGIWRLLEPLLAGDLRKETRKEMAALKQLAEQGNVARSMAS